MACRTCIPGPIFTEGDYKVQRCARGNCDRELSRTHISKFVPPNQNTTPKGKDPKAKGPKSKDPKGKK